MANKKISELQTRTPSLTDLILVGDPSNGFSYKCTVSALATIIETDIADGYVTLGTTQTISGAKTFSNNLTLTSVANASTDPDKFLVLNGSNIVNYRTGSEVLSDIGGQGALTLTTTGTSGAATLVGNTLNIPNYAPDLSGYVPTSRTITINGTTQDLTANRTYNVGTVTSVALSAPTGFAVTGSPITSSGTLALAFDTGYSLPTTASQSNWDTAYTNRITSLTTTGSSGSATLISNTLNIPTYTLAGLGGISLTSLSAFVPLIYNNTTGQFSITQSNSTNDGYLSATDWNTFNNKQATITLTTTGTSGAATFTSNTLNIPQYQGALTLTTTGTSGAATLVGNTLNIPQYSGGGGSVSGTTNYIAKFTSSTAVGDSQIFDDGTNVGISTATAGSKLQINGNAAIGYSTSTAATSNGLAVAGRVGIGTNTPSGGLQVSLTDVYNYFSSNSQAATLTDVQGLAIGWNRSNGGGETILVYNKGAGSTGGLAFSNNDGGTYNERMRLTSAGSLGILTATIGSTLQVNGNAAIGYSASTAAPSNGLVVSGNVGFNTTTIGSRLQINGNAAIGYSASTAAPTNGLMVAGNVGVNVTPSAWASGFRAIQIGARTSFYNTDINFTGISNNSFYDGTFWRYLTTAATSSIELGAGVITFGTGSSGTAGAVVSGGERARIHTDGVFYIGNGDAVASPNTGIVSATGGSGTNIAGAEFRIRGGASTGSANGGAITFYTSTAGASGTTVRAGTEKMRITSDGQITLATGANVSAIAQTGYSLTGSNASSLIDLAGTWNTTGNPTAIKLNITNTASGASAYLMDLQVGGTTQFRVTKAGAIRTTAPTGGTANDWKLGTRVAAIVVLDTTQYAEVEIGGTLYKLAMVN